MKYIFRTLWVIGYIPVFILTAITFLAMIFVYPLIRAFYFIKTGDCENCPFTPDVLAGFMDNKYKKLLKYIKENE